MKHLRAFYLILANTAVVFLCVVFAAHLALTCYYRLQEHSQYRSLSPAAKLNYSHMTEAEVEDLLRATNTMRYRYAPLIGMTEAVTRSRFVNVDENGIRSNGGPRRSIEEIQDAIWFFGGSSTFGYGVADAETIPAQLEVLMGRPVINFGAAMFYSAQENLLLVQYVRSGYRPAMAVFLDGINESCDIDEYQDEMALLFDAVQRGYHWDPRELGKPAIHAYAKFRDKLMKTTGDSVKVQARHELTCEAYGKRQSLRTVHARLLAERESLCRMYAVECVTVVQPFVHLHGRYDDVTVPEADRSAMREKFRLLQQNWRNAGAVFVTDALDKHERHAYIDEAHYSAAASRVIAEAIATRIGNRRK